jgi:hypothetical protein
MSKKSLTSITLAALILAGMFTRVALSKSGERAGPSRRELYQYIWDFVVVGDGKATTEDLKHIASYYSGRKKEMITKIDQTFASTALSGKQKRESICGLCPNIRYGTVVTTAGKTHKGLIELWNWHNDYPRSRYLEKSYMPIQLTKGGTTTVALRDIVDIDLSNDSESIIKTNKAKLLHGKIKIKALVHVSGSEPLEIEHTQLKRLVFGTLKHIQCPECFRVMEIDWKYCAYDGTRLTDGKKWVGAGK